MQKILKTEQKFRLKVLYGVQRYRTFWRNLQLL